MKYLVLIICISLSFTAKAENSEIVKVLDYYSSKIIPFEPLPVVHREKATRKEALQCVSWLQELDKVIKTSPVLDQYYIVSLMMEVGLDNNFESMKLIKEARKEKPLLNSCSKAGLENWKLKMFERFANSKKKEDIPKKILSCMESLIVINSVVIQMKNPRVSAAAHSLGQLIGVKAAISEIIIDGKYELNEKIMKIMTEGSTKLEKYKADDLKSSWFKEMQSNCLVFQEESN